MSKIYLFLIIIFFIVSCATIKTERDDLKGITSYYTSDVKTEGAFLYAFVYDEYPNSYYFNLNVKTDELSSPIDMQEVYFFDNNTRENISFKLEKIGHYTTYTSGYISSSGYYYQPQKLYIGYGLKSLNKNELDTLYNFMIKSTSTKIRFYGNFTVDYYLSIGQKKNIIEIIKRYKNNSLK